jgi:hypothetical protein
VAARLTQNGAARLEIVSGSVSHVTATARLRVRTLTASNDAKLRFALPKKLAAKVRIGTLVTLRLTVRAGRIGCAPGLPSTLRTRTRVAWVPR